MKVKLPDNWPRPNLLTLVGSHAYGLATPVSDWDYKGFYIAPSEDFWSLKTPNEQYHSPEIEGHLDVTLWEVGKFIKLCLQANPAVLEVLYGLQHAVCYTAAQRIIQERRIFLSKRVAHTYKGYASSQIHKSKRDIQAGVELRPKALCHCLRILLSGKHLLLTGDVLVHAGPNLELLKKVRSGEVPYEKVWEMCEGLFKDYDSFVEHSVLPEEPDMESANRLLVSIRKDYYSP